MANEESPARAQTAGNVRELMRWAAEARNRPLPAGHAVVKPRPASPRRFPFH